MARINLLVMTKDKEYTERFSTFFALKHSSEVQFYTLSNANQLPEFLKINKIDVALIEEGMGVDFSLFPESTATVYLAESEYANEKDGRKVIGMYQKAEKLYKIILELYAEESKAIIGSYHAEGQARLISFMSASGGAGSTTVSIAYAKSLAASGKKVFYFGFDMLPSYNLYLSGDHLGTMSDVLYSLKSPGVNLNVKLRGLINTDKSGVYFFDKFSVPADVLDLNEQDIGRLVEEVKKIDDFDCFVFDFNFAHQEIRNYFLRNSASIIVVCEDTVSSFEKYQMFMQLISFYEQSEGMAFVDRISVIANKCKNLVTDRIGDRLIGEISKIGGIGEDEIPDYLSLKFKDLFLSLNR